MEQKIEQGVAEKRRGRRGPGSVIGSSAAGCICALLTIFGVGGGAFSQLWRLGFVASFCTKLSDTVASEIGKAYGKTTWVPSVELCLIWTLAVFCCYQHLKTFIVVIIQVNFHCKLWSLMSRYLVTTFKVVPRGTEGAVSVEGTLAGILASVVLAFVSFLLGEVLP